MDGTVQGQWLRRQRRARGWSVVQRRQQLRAAARAAGDSLPDNEYLSGMIRRWERGDNGMSERYQMHYCRAFGISHEEFSAARPAAESGPAEELSFEQLHDEVIRLAQDYMTGELYDRRAL
jgi:transcriptional regulator with XRE-family HTH domain